MLVNTRRVFNHKGTSTKSTYGAFYAVLHGSGIKVRDTSSLEQVRRLPAANYSVASFSPDGSGEGHG